MENHRTIPLSLGAGETRRLLLEAGSTVLVLSGQMVWRDPPVWVAESVVANAQSLGPEEARVVESSSWVEFSAQQAVQAVIIAPDGVAFWAQVGHCLAHLFGTSDEQKRAL